MIFLFFNRKYITNINYSEIITNHNQKEITINEIADEIIKLRNNSINDLFGNNGWISIVSIYFFYSQVYGCLTRIVKMNSLKGTQAKKLTYFY